MGLSAWCQQSIPGFKLSPFGIACKSCLNVCNDRRTEFQPQVSFQAKQGKWVGLRLNATNCLVMQISFWGACMLMIMLQLQCCSGASVCTEMPYGYSVAVRTTDVYLALSSALTRDLRNPNWTKIDILQPYHLERNLLTLLEGFYRSTVCLKYVLNLQPVWRAPRSCARDFTDDN